MSIGMTGFRITHYHYQGVPLQLPSPSSALNQTVILGLGGRSGSAALGFYSITTSPPSNTRAELVNVVSRRSPRHFCKNSPTTARVPSS